MENIEYIIKLSHKRATMPTMMHDVQSSLAVETYFGEASRATELRVYATSLIMILLGFPLSAVAPLTPSHFCCCMVKLSSVDGL